MTRGYLQPYSFLPIYYFTHHRHSWIVLRFIQRTKETRFNNPCFHLCTVFTNQALARVMNSPSSPLNRWHAPSSPKTRAASSERIQDVMGPGQRSSRQVTSFNFVYMTAIILTRRNSQPSSMSPNPPLDSSVLPGNEPHRRCIFESGQL